MHGKIRNACVGDELELPEGRVVVQLFKDDGATTALSCKSCLYGDEIKYPTCPGMEDQCCRSYRRPDRCSIVLIPIKKHGTAQHLRNENKPLRDAKGHFIKRPKEDK